MTPHIFFVDVDGTLLRSGQTLSPVVAAAAGRFQREGGHVVLCTGRSPLSTRTLARAMGITAPCILFSGAALYDFAGETAVRTFPLPEDIRETIGAIAAMDSDISVQAYTVERAYLVQSGPVLVERGIREELEAETTGVDGIEGEILKLVLTHPRPERLRECAETVLDGRHHFAFASRRFAEVVACGADKGAGAKVLAGLLDVPLACTFAAGDAMTDVPMLEMCGYSFVPRDGRPEALAVGDETIPSCDEDGMATAFSRALDMMTKR